MQEHVNNPSPAASEQEQLRWPVGVILNGQASAKVQVNSHEATHSIPYSVAHGKLLERELKGGIVACVLAGGQTAWVAPAVTVANVGQPAM